MVCKIKSRNAKPRKCWPLRFSRYMYWTLAPIPSIIWKRKMISRWSVYSCLTEPKTLSNTFTLQIRSEQTKLVIVTYIIAADLRSWWPNCPNPASQPSQGPYFTFATVASKATYAIIATFLAEQRNQRRNPLSDNSLGIKWPCELLF